MPPWSVMLAIAALILFVFTAILLASRYKRCPSDAIMVIYGKVGANESARTLHGGGALVIPLIQDYAFMSLTPMTISIPLKSAGTENRRDGRWVRIRSSSRSGVGRPVR